MNRRKQLGTKRARQDANVTMLVLGVMSVLLMICGTILAKTLRTYRHVSHVTTWQEAILAAEAGADIAIAELRKTMTAPGTAFADWSNTDRDGNLLPNQGRRFVPPSLRHVGEGNTILDAEVIIDSPSDLLDGKLQWHRIRSTGTTYLPGAAYPVSERRDNALRRLSFFKERNFDNGPIRPITRPQAKRMIELVVKPVGLEDAIVSNDAMTLNNHNIIVDSYNSQDPTKSTNGLYDPAKRQQNGDIATNGKLIDAGSAYIYGDAFTNSGSVVNAGNISGVQRNDYYKPLSPVQKPNWTIYELSLTSITRGMTLTGGSKASPKRYKLSRMSLDGSESLVIAPSAPGVESYVEIWLTGDLKASGNGTITVQPNANLKIFIEGGIDIKGNGTFNANSQPKRLQILGVAPSTTTPPTMYFSGNGIFVGAVYAPNHSIEFGSTGSIGTFWGSLTGKSVNMSGSSMIHYDEALGEEGPITDYRIKSWFEDNR